MQQNRSDNKIYIVYNLLISGWLDMIMVFIGAWNNINITNLYNIEAQKSVMGW